MNKKILIILVVLAGIAGLSWLAYRYAGYQQKIYRIGILSRGTFYQPALESYKKKMAELGYVEGKNVEYDLRIVSTREEINAAAKDFVEKNLDLIHTYSTPATVAVYKETKAAGKEIPVVFGSVGDPLASGVVLDTQRPGTNVTGVASLSTELTAKRLELLRELNPQIKRVGMPHTATDAGDIAANKSVDIAKQTAQGLGITLVFYPVKTSAEIEPVAKTILRKDVEGLIIGGDSLTLGGIEAFAKQAIAQKILFAAFDLSNVQKGALIGFGPDYAVSGEQSAIISNQILRGASPAQIPIEIPQKLLLAINLDTARAIGFPIKEELIHRADVTIGK